MKKTLYLVAAMAAACACSNPQAEQLDELFSGLFPADEPGAAVLVMQGDDIIFDKGYGLATLDGAEIDGDTFFNIASCSKQFTAVAVMQLAKEGLVSLEDKVCRYFPEFTDSIWTDIRIKHLLSHSSGIPDGRGYLTREQKVNGTDTLATEYLFTLDHVNFPAGTQYEYINPTFTLMGQLIERVTGQEFETYMREHVFSPAGMDKTLYFNRYHQDLIPNMAHGYEYEDVSDMPEERTAGTAGDEPKNWYEYDFGEETFFATRPDGGIYTSTHELVKWEQALRSGTVLATEALADAWSPKTPVSGSEWSDYQNRPGTWYGYGWFLEPEKGVIYHTGDNGGFKILIARYPETGTLVMVLSNRADWDRYEVKSEVEKILGL